MGTCIDLHLHTAASDGSDTPAQLLRKLRAAGIHTFSVTDHDTIDGTLEMARLVPKEMHHIFGVEFSCTTAFRKCHILGYGFDPENTELQEVLAIGKQLRLKKLQKRIELLEEKFGITLTDAEMVFLLSKNSPGKPHFGELIAARGLAPDTDSAIKAYVNPCKVKDDRIDAGKVIRAISHAGGIPVWAHPLGGEGEKRLTEAEFESQYRILLDLGIQGLECHYSRYDSKDIQFLTDQAESRNLLISGGSDYHGTAKTGLSPGMLNSEGRIVDPHAISLLKNLLV